MIYFWFILYNLIIYPLIFILVSVGAIFNKKLRIGLIGRFNSINILKTTLQNWDKKKPIYWFHAASHGEFEQIKPVLRGIKEVENDIYIVVSFFSPSGYNNVNDKNINCKIYLPFDFIWSIRRALKIVNPKFYILLLCSRTIQCILNSPKMYVLLTSVCTKNNKSA